LTGRRRRYNTVWLFFGVVFATNSQITQIGYGGFSISINPFFSPAMLTVMQKYGAILAVPNIRGGSEFGEEWHLAGTRERKINVFNDFIAAT
jgi:prolyl oligopeptidase